MKKTLLAPLALVVVIGCGSSTPAPVAPPPVAPANAPEQTPVQPRTEPVMPDAMLDELVPIAKTNAILEGQDVRISIGCRHDNGYECLAKGGKLDPVMTQRVVDAIGADRIQAAPNQSVSVLCSKSAGNWTCEYAYGEVPHTAPPPPAFCADTVELEAGKKHHAPRDESEATSVTGNLEVEWLGSKMNLYSPPPSVDICGEVATLESDGTTSYVELSRGSGPSADVRPLAFGMRLPKGVAAPFAVGDVIRFQQLIRPMPVGFLQYILITGAQGETLLATKATGMLISLGPVVSQEREGPGTYRLHRVDVTLGGKTARLQPKAWRRLSTPDGTWLMLGVGSSWGPGPRPADSHGALYVTLIGERSAPAP